MKHTAYFQRRVLDERPYIRLEWCLEAVHRFEHREVQEDGRIRFWKFVAEQGRYLRVITLEDGETLHNAFFDRSFRPQGHRDHP